MLKNVIFRTFGFRRLHAGPPADYIFKREVVPSDFDVEKELWCDNKYLNKKDFEKKGDKKGSDLYYPKYGSSIYDDKIVKDKVKGEREKWKRLNSRED